MNASVVSRLFNHVALGLGVQQRVSQGFWFGARGAGGRQKHAVDQDLDAEPKHPSLFRV